MQRRSKRRSLSRVSVSLVNYTSIIMLKRITFTLLVVYLAKLLPSSRAPSFEELEDKYLNEVGLAVEESRIDDWHEQCEANTDPRKWLLPESNALPAQGTMLECPSLPDSITKVAPTSVHALSPYHIKVIGAVGDSITTTKCSPKWAWSKLVELKAGFGAKATTLFRYMNDFRGISFSIGGDDDVTKHTSLPNILKKFSPKLRGYSLKKGKRTSKNANFNLALTGALSSTLPRLTQELIDKIKADETVNVQEDWKVITVLIGGNDMCMYCKDKEGRSPDYHANHVKESLDMIKNELPKTFVNVIQLLDLTLMRELKRGLFCKAAHRFACPCFAKKKHWNATHEAHIKYNKRIEEMILQTPEYHDSDDFTVVLQPFLTNTRLPVDGKGNKDQSYFALDCFHFSTKGHSAAGRALWNNMLQPVGSKEDFINFHDQNFRCPTMESPYLYTYKNSGKAPKKSHQSHTEL